MRTRELGDAVPKIPSQTPGLTITRVVCASEAIVVATDIEKMENRRKCSMSGCHFCELNL